MSHDITSEPSARHALVEPEQQATTPARWFPARVAPARGGTLTPAALLALQRTAGNHAVSRFMLGRQAAAPEAPAAPAAPAAQASGEPISVALYLPAELDVHGSGEFKRQAETWAQNHGAMGVDRDGHPHSGRAMRIDNNRPQETLRRVLEAVRESRHLPAGTHVPLAALAVFTHGESWGLQIGRDSEGAGGQHWGDLHHERPADQRPSPRALGPLLEIVAESIVAHGDVIFYACSTAGPAVPVEGNAYRNLVQETYEYLTEHGASEDVEVWGHNTARHTTGNPDTASSSGVGREQLYTELAERSFAARGGTPDAQGAAEVIAQLAAMWNRALRPTGNQAAMYALIEEIPLLGYDAFYRAVAGVDAPDTALAVFPAYTRGDRALFTRAVAIVRGRFDSAAADALVARALGQPAAPASEPRTGDIATPPSSTERHGPPPSTVRADAEGRQPATGGATLTLAQLARALAFYQRRAYPEPLLQALRSAVGAPGGSAPADETFVEAVARYQAVQTPPLSADGMAGPVTLGRLGLDARAAAPHAARPDSLAAA